MKHTPLALLLTMALAAPASAQSPLIDETPAQHDARMAWFRDARFGMFIHWGVYSVPAGEYKDQKDHAEWFLETTRMPVSEYEKFAAQFNPTKFDAHAWAALAKRAGMKYLVITSKHHDGFAIYPSALTDWCIKDTPFGKAGRDPLKELAEACKDEGIRFCTYHSIMDWHHPDWGIRRAWNDKATGTPDMDRFDAYLKGQVAEVVKNYHPGIMWFDGQWEGPWTEARGKDMYAYLRKLDPQLIINNRVGGGTGDYGTPEQTIPATGFGPGVDWESCMTLNDHWGYNKNDHNWKSVTTIIRNLVDCASKGGNYLLNVGPTAEGVIPAESVERLTKVGDWMKVNGESIYRTTASPFRKTPWGRCTRKGSTLYLHVFGRPEGGSLVVPMSNKVRKASFLADSSLPIYAGSQADGQHLALPPDLPDAEDSVIAVTVDGEVEPIVVRIPQDADGKVTLKAADADLAGGVQAEHEPPNIGFWTTAEGAASWPIEVSRPGTFAVSLDYAVPPAGAPSAFVLTAGEGTLSATAAPTKGFDDYTRAEVGTITLAKGPATLTIKPAKAVPSGLMNLRAVTLTPRP
ncbi:Alpha-L-fucosidase [Aquisphaera giovannonii]|uniref:alpha-L-fucosidase n=1 Tax=Aquisphaera giovannonii TaxID=406548 RepID=A0A5B9VVL0_9BACT|nr:alpha-L-fucosidase [Aquisphaera giovannonii]QEH32383.1 Alpha-L-fucosidase [Aquisphaera giovannonii]